MNCVISWNQGHCWSESKKKDDRESVVDKGAGGHPLLTVSCPDPCNLGWPQPDITWMHMGGQKKEAGTELDEEEHAALSLAAASWAQKTQYYRSDVKHMQKFQTGAGAGTQLSW